MLGGSRWQFRPPSLGACIVKIAIAGPIETGALGDATGIDMAHLPRGQGPAPTVPLAAELVRQGFETHIVTLDASIAAPVSFESGKLKITFVPLRAPPRYPHRSRMADLFGREIRLLTDAILSTGAEVVNAHWTYEYSEAAVRSRLPHVATMHDLGWDYLMIYRDIYRAMRLLMMYRVMPRIRHMTAVAPFVAAKAWQYGYMGKVDVIANPILQPADGKRQNSAVNLVTIGNAGRIKNVAASIAAFEIIRRTIPDAKLHLFGPELGADGAFGNIAGVVPHGNTPHTDLMCFLEREATLLVHPSRIEACPVILGEAKIRRLPLVAGKASAGVNFVVGNAGGVLVDIEKPQQIADATLGILSDPDYYQILQDQGHADAMQRFTVDRITRQYLDCYERALTGIREAAR